MTARGESAPGGLSLSESADGPAVAAPWIGRLVTLGSRAARWSRSRAAGQLIIVLSVPTRDFAAALIGCGWLMANPRPMLEPVAEAAASLAIGTHVRVVTPTKIITDELRGIDLARNRLRLTTEWMIDRLQAIAPIGQQGVPRSQPLLPPGVINRLAGFADSWAARMCCPTHDLALVGTLKWLTEDIGCYLGVGAEREPIAQVLWPEQEKAATWSTRLYAATKLEPMLPLPVELRAAVLDGATAARYLRAIETSVVFVVLDRSVADAAASELVVEYRNTRGTDISLRDTLSWQPSGGIEAVAFSVPM